MFVFRQNFQLSTSKRENFEHIEMFFVCSNAGELENPSVIFGFMIMTVIYDKYVV